MHIKLVSAENVKGRSFDYTLGRVNLIIGDNFSGKTAVTDAVKIGLLGYLPRLGKQPQSTFAMAGAGSSMSITLQMDPTGIVKHSWKKEAKGNVKYDSDIPLNVRTPVVLLDTREYFEKTALDRLRYVFRQMPVKEWNDADVTTQIDAIEALPINVARPVVDDCSKTVAASIKTREIQQLTVQEWLDSLIKTFTDKKKAADVTAKQQSGTIVSLKSTALQYPPKLVDCSQKIAELGKELSGIQDALTRLQQVKENAEKTAKRKAFLEAELKGRVSQVDKINELDALRIKMEQELVETKVASDDYQSKFNSVSSKANQIQQRIDLLRTEREERKKKITSVQEMDRCPFCYGASDNWKEHLVSTIQQQIAQMDAEIVQRCFEVAEQQGQLRELNNLINRSSTAKDAWMGLKERIQQTNEALKDLQNQEFQAAQYRAELDNLQQMELPDPKKVQELVDKRSELETKRADLTEKQNAWVGKQNVDSQIAKATSSLVEKSCAVEVYKKAVEIIVTIQSDMVQDVFNALLEKARLFTDGILLSPLEYRDGELGRMDGTHWISHETFSGTEELLAYAGLSVALAQNASCKLVIMDELGRLTPKLKSALLNRMHELTKNGSIDQFIGIDCDLSSYQYRLNDDAVNVITIN